MHLALQRKVETFAKGEKNYDKQVHKSLQIRFWMTIHIYGQLSLMFDCGLTGLMLL